MRTNIDGLSRYSLWGIFVLALAARLLYWYQAADNPLMYIPLVDEEYHADYGRSLAGGNWLGESQPFFMDPLYGYFLGAVFWIFGDNLAIARLIQLFVDGVTAVLLVSVGRRLQFPAAGMIAGALYACYPVAWFYSLLLLKTTLTTHVLVLFVWLLLGKGVSSRLLTWLGLGVLAGIGVYLRGNLILLVPLAVGWLLLQRHRPLSRTAAPALLLIAGMGIVLLAGGARNAAVSGQFVMLPQTAGITLYSTNNPEAASGGYESPSFVTVNHPAHLVRQYTAEAQRRLGRPLSLSEVSAYWRLQALEYWFSDPRVLPQLILGKFRHLIAPQEIAYNQSYQLSARFAPILAPSLPLFAIALALGLPGLAYAAFKDRRGLALWIPVVIVFATCLIFFASSRYRFPMVPFLLLGCGITVCGAWKGLASRGRSVVAAATASLLALSIAFGAVPPRTPNLEINLALAFARVGLPAQAQEIFDSLTDELGNQSRFHEARGSAAMLALDYPAALAANERALELNPTNLVALHNAGISALQMEMGRQAWDFFARAWALTGKAEYLYWQGVAAQAAGAPAAAQHLLSDAFAQTPAGSLYHRRAAAALKAHP